MGDEPGRPRRRGTVRDGDARAGQGRRDLRPWPGRSVRASRRRPRSSGARAARRCEPGRSAPAGVGVAGDDRRDHASADQRHPHGLSLRGDQHSSGSPRHGAHLPAGRRTIRSGGQLLRHRSHAGGARHRVRDDARARDRDQPRDLVRRQACLRLRRRRLAHRPGRRERRPAVLARRRRRARVPLDGPGRRGLRPGAGAPGEGPRAEREAPLGAHLSGVRAASTYPP